MAFSLKKKYAPQKTADAIQEAAPLMNIGFELAGTVGGFGLIGWFIDKYAGTTPFWFVALLIFGVIGGMTKFILTVIRYSNKQKAIHIETVANSTSDISRSDIP
ncbi:MAG: AtpZ/AtpI family protein [Candidatus Kapaibacteriota bacterium]|jgi:F0F1-type ATP synthase assembly protein I